MQHFIPIPIFVPRLSTNIPGVAGKRKDGASGHKESAGTPIAPGTASAAAQQRERDFSDLRDRKDDVVS